MSDPESYNRKEIIHRIGTFFLMMALGLMVFFLLSEAEGTPMFGYFCWGTALATLGFMFRAQHKRTSASSGRFGWWRNFFKGNKE